MLQRLTYQLNVISRFELSRDVADTDDDLLPASHRSAISDVVKDLLSAISRKWTSFRGEGHEDMSPELVTVSGKLLCRRM